MHEFCYLGDKLKTNEGCDTAATARMRIGWIEFRERSELLLGKKDFVEGHSKSFQS